VSQLLHDKLQKCQAEQGFLKQRRDEIEADKKRLQEQYVMLKTSLQSTEEESQKMDVEKTNVDEKM